VKFKTVKNLLKKLQLPRIIFLPPLGENQWCISLGFVAFIALREDSERLTVFHEIGHHFYSAYKNTLINPKEFKRLFGNPHKWYFGWWYFNPNWEDEIDEKPEYLHNYAQTHPLEDWAECFSVAMRDLNKKNRFYGNRKLNAKIEFARKCILAAQK
jgi:hypothetical protein